MRKKTNNVNTLMRITSIMFLLVLLTAYSISGLYARYVTNNSDDDGARVAKFEVNITNLGQAPVLNGTTYNGDTQTLDYEFSITNSSEVVVNYKIIIDFGKALPESMSLKIDDQQIQVGDGKTSSFEFDGSTFALNETEKTHTLSIIVVYVDKYGNAAYADDFITAVKIIVEAEQGD